MHELKYEAIKDKVRSGDSEWRCQAVQLGSCFVGRMDLIPELEAEYLLVEALRARKVPNDLSSVVVRSHIVLSRSD
jgi:hypothetical protein